MRSWTAEPSRSAGVGLGLTGVAQVTGTPEQRERVGRLLDLILDGLRYGVERQG